MFSEFRGITNHEAYKKVFVDRMMLQSTNDPKLILGNTQRQDFLPFLLPLVRDLPLEAHILDVGAGSGEIVDLALTEAVKASVTIAEPNPLLSHKYQERIKYHPNLTLADSYVMRAQDLYRQSATARVLKVENFDLALALHMIYHVTPLSRDSNDPGAEIIDFLSFLYGALKPGGTIFVVYSDDDTATTSHASDWYLRKTGQMGKLDQLKRIEVARHDLLKNGRIGEVLANKFPSHPPKLLRQATDSWIYGKSLEDMAILCLLSDDDLCNESRFDENKLNMFYEFIETRADVIQLGLERRAVPQRDMYRFYQGQVVLTISKSS